MRFLLFLSPFPFFPLSFPFPSLSLWNHPLRKGDAADDYVFSTDKSSNLMTKLFNLIPIFLVLFSFSFSRIFDISFSKKKKKETIEKAEQRKEGKKIVNKKKNLKPFISRSTKDGIRDAQRGGVQFDSWLRPCSWQ